MKQPTRAVPGHAARRNKIVALGMLFAILGVIWGRNLFSGPRVTNAGTSATEVAPGTTPEVTSERTVGQAPVQFTWSVDVQRNPFALDAAAFERRDVDDPPVVIEPDPIDAGVSEEDLAEALESIALQGTFISRQPRAMINDQLYVVGDAVEGFEIVRIEMRRVVLRRDGLDFVIEVPLSREVQRHPSH